MNLTDIFSTIHRFSANIKYLSINISFWIDILFKMHYSVTLTKVSNRNSFRVNQNYSDSFRYLYPSQCESFRTNPKNVLYLVWWKSVINQSDLTRLIPRHESEPIRKKFSIRINQSLDWSKPNFQSESIWMNPRSEWFGLILIENSVWINPSSDRLRLIRIGLDSFG